MPPGLPVNRNTDILKCRFMGIIKSRSPAFSIGLLKCDVSTQVSLSVFYVSVFFNIIINSTIATNY